MNKDYFWQEYTNNEDSILIVERGYFRGQWTERVSIEGLYQAFKSRLMAELKADRQGDLYERPEGDDE